MGLHEIQFYNFLVLTHCILMCFILNPNICTQGVQCGWGGAPQQTSKNLLIKIQSNTKIEDPPIFSQPRIPPSKEFDNGCASMNPKPKETL